MLQSVGLQRVGHNWGWTTTITTTTNYSLYQGATRKNIYWYSKWIDFKCEMKFTFLLQDKNLNIKKKKKDLLCLWPPLSPLCSLCTCIMYWTNLPHLKKLIWQSLALTSNGQSSSQSFLKCSSWVIILKFGPSKILNLFLRLMTFYQSIYEEFILYMHIKYRFVLL